MMIQFFIEGDPKTQLDKKKGKWGNVYGKDPSGRKRAWGEWVAIKAKSAMGDTVIIPITVPFKTTFIFYLKRRKCDVEDYPIRPTSGDDDNYAYLITNILKGICYEDDCHRVRQVVELEFAIGEPGVNIKIETLEKK